MIRGPCIFLWLAVVSVSSQAADINKDIDVLLEKYDQMFSIVGLDAYPIPPMDNAIFRICNISYNDASLMGMNSIVRTGNCTKTERTSPDNWKYLELHLGLRLFTLLFPKLKINNDFMSGYLRFKDNSFKFAITVDRGAECKVSFVFDIDRLRGGEFSSSDVRYDGMTYEVDTFFLDEAQPFLSYSAEMFSMEVQPYLEDAFCGRPPKRYINPSLLQLIRDL